MFIYVYPTNLDLQSVLGNAINESITFLLSHTSGTLNQRGTAAEVFSLDYTQPYSHTAGLSQSANLVSSLQHTSFPPFLFRL